MTRNICFLLLGLTFIFAISCKKGNKDIDPEGLDLSEASSTYTAAIINEYSALQLRLIAATPGYEAPVAARSMAYMAIAAYEAAVPGMPDNESLVGKIEGLEDLPQPDNSEEYHWGIAVNAAEHALMKKIYGTTSDVFKIKMDTLKKKYENFYKTGIGVDVVERSIRFGAEIAQSVWDYSQSDGGHLAYDNNFPISNSTFEGVAIWQPTGLETRPLLPNWGKVRSFSKANSAYVSSKPKDFSFKGNSSFFDEAFDIYQTSVNINNTQKEIMDFWDTPSGSITQPGNQLALVATLMNKENYKLDQAVKLNLKITMAMHDALVASWKCKFENNLMRPVTYIKQAIDPEWTPLQSILPVPDYTSEQSSIVAAVSNILAAEFGEEYLFEATSQFHNTLKRGYKNFSSYSKEAQAAQAYAGLHYRMSIENGALQGESIANNILSIDLSKASLTDSTNTMSISY